MDNHMNMFLKTIENKGIAQGNIDCQKPNNKETLTNIHFKYF